MPWRRGSSLHKPLYSFTLSMSLELLCFGITSTTCTFDATFHGLLRRQGKSSYRIISKVFRISSSASNIASTLFSYAFEPAFLEKTAIAHVSFQNARPPSVANPDYDSSSVSRGGFSYACEDPEICAMFNIRCVHRLPSNSGRVGQQAPPIAIASPGRLMEWFHPSYHPSYFHFHPVLCLL